MKRNDQNRRDLERQRILNGLLQCAYCNTPMLKVGTNFICPTQVTGAGQPCPTSPVNAWEMLQLAVTRFIDRVLNEAATEQVAGMIQAECGEKSRQARESLDQAEAAIAELNTLKNRAIHEVEHHSRPYHSVADEIDRINRTTIALAHEARVSRREIDAYKFVGDPDLVRKTARDPETYLDTDSPDDLRNLLNMFIRSIEAEQDHVTINFSSKVPRADQHQYDRVKLGE